MKSLDKGADKIDDIILVEKTVDELYNQTKAMTMMPGWPEDLDNIIATDKARLMEMFSSVIIGISDLIEDMVDEEMTETSAQEAAEEASESI